MKQVPHINDEHGFKQMYSYRRQPIIRYYSYRTKTTSCIFSSFFASSSSLFMSFNILSSTIFFSLFSIFFFFLSSAFFFSSSSSTSSLFLSLFFFSYISLLLSFTLIRNQWRNLFRGRLCYAKQFPEINDEHGFKQTHPYRWLPIIRYYRRAVPNFKFRVL